MKNSESAMKNMTVSVPMLAERDCPVIDLALTEDVSDTVTTSDGDCSKRYDVFQLLLIFLEIVC